MINNDRTRQLLAGGLLLLVSGCDVQLVPGSEAATRIMELKDVMRCLHIGNTQAGLDEDNSRITVTGSSYEMDAKLLSTVRNLADEIGADTVVPIYKDDNLIKEFKLYSCRIRTT